MHDRDCGGCHGGSVCSGTHEGIDERTEVSIEVCVVWRACVAEPEEATWAVLTFVFHLTMCGNSPLAWLAAMGFASVSSADWRFFLARFGEVAGEPSSQATSATTTEFVCSTRNPS